MNTTGQNGEKNGYKVILLLVVGLTAFSSAMNELNQLQQFSLDATRLIAQWSDKFTPAPVPSVPAVPQTAEVKQTVVKVESCEIKQSLPSVELPWLSPVTRVARAASAAPRAVVPRPSQIIEVKDVPKPNEFQLAKLKKFAQIDIDPADFNFTFTTPAGPDPTIFSELPMTPSRGKTRNGRQFRINTRDHEIFLKSFNRSINVRVAS